MEEKRGRRGEDEEDEAALEARDDGSSATWLT
jgi:hypothetical protein